MRRIAVINQKGGVGKTTTSANLGAALAEQGRRVVVVDMDPQANLSLHLGVELASSERSIYPVLLGRTKLAEAITSTSTPGLSLVPSTIDLSGAELELAATFGRERVLLEAVEAWQRAAEEAGAGAPADYLIFDCPPSLGLLSVNALAAATEVVITVQTEFMALMGMSKLVEVVELMKTRLNPTLEISGILPCLYDSRLRLAREVLGELRGYFPGQVFRSPIRANVKLAEAPSFGKTIFEYAPDSNGALDYRRAALEVLAQEARDPALADLPAPRALASLPTRLEGEGEGEAARATAGGGAARPAAGPVTPAGAPRTAPAPSPAPAAAPSAPATAAPAPAAAERERPPAAPREGAAEALREVVLRPPAPPRPAPAPARTEAPARPTAPEGPRTPPAPPTPPTARAAARPDPPAAAAPARDPATRPVATAPAPAPARATPPRSASPAGGAPARTAGARPAAPPSAGAVEAELRALGAGELPSLPPETREIRRRRG